MSAIFCHFWTDKKLGWYTSCTLKLKKKIQWNDFLTSQYACIKSLITMEHNIFYIMVEKFKFPSFFLQFEATEIFGQINEAQIYSLTNKLLQTHRCILSTLATDPLLLKHQAISIHSADQISIALDQFQTKILHSWWTLETNEHWKKMTQLFKGSL